MRQIIGKTISRDQAGSRSPAGLICDGHSVGTEAAISIHAMAQMFDDDGTDGILLVDCNIQITCREMSMSSTCTEVPRDCSPVEGKRSYPRKGQHRVTL